MDTFSELVFKLLNNDDIKFKKILRFERQIYAQTQDLQIFKMSEKNPEEVFRKTAYSVQLP